MLKQFCSVFLFAPVLLSMGVAVPAIAQTTTVETLRATTQRAVCLGEWGSAIQSVNQLMASSEITPTYRETLLSYRRQLEGYRSSNARVDMRQQPGCEGAIAPVHSATPQANRGMNWEGAIANVSGQQGRPAAQVDSPAAGTSRTSVASESTCDSSGGGNRRVSSGTVSNRWVYEMFDGNGSFYIRYWQQHDCRSVRTYGSHNTQSELRRDFLEYIRGL